MCLACTYEPPMEEAAARESDSLPTADGKAVPPSDAIDARTPEDESAMASTS